ncbi:MAG: RbsD/FucU domain-containing protein [Microbacteriaceae bacterium]
MLKGIHPLISPPLLAALAQMGHGDEIAIVDGNFPARSVAAREPIRLDGASATEAAAAILTLMPLDRFVAAPVVRMRVEGAGERWEPVHTELREIAEHAEGRPISVLDLSRTEFYARAREAYAVVATGETRPYGCFLLAKGVWPELVPEGAP